LPAIAQPITATTTDTSAEHFRTDDATVTVLTHENIHLTMWDDGSYVWVVHYKSDLTIKYDDGFTYRETVNYPLVTNTKAGNGEVITGEYTTHFQSGDYKDIFHSTYTYANGEIRVNHYWEKVV
jgi:hypothetical protein